MENTTNTATITNRNELREFAYDTLLAQLNIEGCDFDGRVEEGLLFYNSELDAHIVIKVIAKKEGYDARTELEFYEEKMEKARKREEERKRKKAEKEATK